MLRNICDRCGKIIDGEPVLDKEYADAALVIDDEVVLCFENLCGDCKKAIRRKILEMDVPQMVEVPQAEIATPEPSEKPQQGKPGPIPEEVSPKPDKAPEEAKQAPQNAAQRLENLPNQVTKQFPINLKTHQKS